MGIRAGGNGRGTTGEVSRKHNRSTGGFGFVSIAGRQCGKAGGTAGEAPLQQRLLASLSSLPLWFRGAWAAQRAQTLPPPPPRGRPASWQTCPARPAARCCGGGAGRRGGAHQQRQRKGRRVHVDKWQLRHCCVRTPCCAPLPAAAHPARPGAPPEDHAHEMGHDGVGARLQGGGGVGWCVCGGGGVCVWVCGWVGGGGGVKQTSRAAG